MKKLAFILSFFLLLFQYGSAQLENPYAEFGLETVKLSTPQEKEAFMLVMENGDKDSEISKIAISPSEKKYYSYDIDGELSEVASLNHDQLGRFLSIDPLAPDFPWNSPYAFSENRVIDGVELEGREWIHYLIHFTRDSSGEIVVLDKTIEEDFRNMSEAEMNRIHGTNNFYSEYSQGFGPEGRNVKYSYHEILYEGKKQTHTLWSTTELESSTTRHGFYAGRGCITLYGQDLTPKNVFGNYDFTMSPIDMGDALAKEHDYLQNIPNHRGFMHVDYLNSDVLFFNKLAKFKEMYENDSSTIDPFTGRLVSQETKDFISSAMTLFAGIIATKVNELNFMLENQQISKEEYDRRMYLVNHPSRSKEAPLPQPQENSN